MGESYFSDIQLQLRTLKEPWTGRSVPRDLLCYPVSYIETSPKLAQPQSSLVIGDGARYFWDNRRSQPVVALFGEPRRGKTSLLLKLAYLAAQEALAVPILLSGSALAEANSPAELLECCFAELPAARRLYGCFRKLVLLLDDIAADSWSSLWELVQHLPGVELAVLVGAFPTSKIDLAEYFQVQEFSLKLQVALAEQLLETAEADLDAPVPVVLNLASWARERLDLSTWLGEAMASTYSMARKWGIECAQDGRFILLLDGLDEVAENDRDGCIEAINLFQKEFAGPMVVCSRIKDYVALQGKLNLEMGI